MNPPECVVQPTQTPAESVTADEEMQPRISEPVRGIRSHHHRSRTILRFPAHASPLPIRPSGSREPTGGDLTAGTRSLLRIGPGETRSGGLERKGAERNRDLTSAIVARRGAGAGDGGGLKSENVE